jgi:hypothetical protein
MKKLKIVTIYLVIVLIVFQQISKGRYYGNILNGDLSGNYGLLYALLQNGWALIIDVFIVVLGIIALSNSDTQKRDWAYSTLRFIYIMSAIMNFPAFVLSFVVSGAQLFKDPLTILLYIFPTLVWITLIVFLVICKPDRQISRVNLQEYDMVAYTSTGHRFIHNLLDYLLMLPAWISTLSYIYWVFYLTGSGYGSFPSELLMICFFFYFLISYVMYYFLAEAMFRQTLGKMITRSCVVGNGVELSNGRVLMRSFCRLIPFDHIAFLFGASWHDSLSATSVVYVDSWEKAFDEKQQEM